MGFGIAQKSCNYTENGCHDSEFDTLTISPGSTFFGERKARKING